MTVARLPRSERRSQLLAVARKAFANNGFHATSMNEIADDAGVTKPVLYQHFDSKRDLFGQVLTDIGHRLDAAVFNKTTRTGSPFERVEAGFSGYLDFIESDREGFSIILSGSTREDPEFGVWAQNFEEKMAATVAELITIEGLSEQEQLAMAHGVVGLVEGMVRYWIANETIEFRRQEILALMTTLAWRGLRH